MTAEQRRLARFALGLSQQEQRRSYRNRFAAAYASPDYNAWRAMVDIGHAMRVPWHYRYGDFFFLTLAGATAALNEGEDLDPEDFPGVPT